MGIFTTKTLHTLRTAIQICFLLWMTGISIRFYLFMRSLENGLVVLSFAAVIATGILSGNWYTCLSYADYQQLVPLVPYLSH